MNRQQFNKYLSGQIYPSKHNLGRIGHFFKLTEEQLCLDPAEFIRLNVNTTAPSDPALSGHIDRAIESLPVDIEALSLYEGFYYTHFHALGFPGSIIRSLIHIYRDNDRFYSKSIEHLWDKNKPGSTRRHRFKYKGVVLYIAGRIFITEYETLAKNNICHTILFPTFRNVVDSLSGITCGVGSLSSHMPLSTRVEMTFLGKEVDLREALRGCSLLPVDSEGIDPMIKERIKSEILPHEFMLTARDH